MASPAQRAYIEAARKRGLPLPDPLPEIRRGLGPAYPPGSIIDGYYDYSTHVVWLARWRDPETLGHELGHAWATLNLVTRELRQQAGAICGHPGLRWYWGRWNPLRRLGQPNEENFADVYMELFCHPPRTRRQRRLLAFLLAVEGRPTVPLTMRR